MSAEGRDQREAREASTREEAKARIDARTRESFRKQDVGTKEGVVRQRPADLDRRAERPSAGEHVEQKRRPEYRPSAQERFRRIDRLEAEHKRLFPNQPFDQERAIELEDKLIGLNPPGYLRTREGGLDRETTQRVRTALEEHKIRSAQELRERHHVEDVWDIFPEGRTTKEPAKR